MTFTEIMQIRIQNVTVVQFVHKLIFGKGKGISKDGLTFNSAPPCPLQICKCLPISLILVKHPLSRLRVAHITTRRGGGDTRTTNKGKISSIETVVNVAMTMTIAIGDVRNDESVGDTAATKKKEIDATIDGETRIIEMVATRTGTTRGRIEVGIPKTARVAFTNQSQFQ